MQCQIDLCKEEQCDQEHLLKYKKLNEENELMLRSLNYNKLFTGTTEEIINISKIMLEKLRKEKN